MKKGKLAGWPSGTGPLLWMVPMLTPRSPLEAAKLRSVLQRTGLGYLGKAGDDRVEADLEGRALVHVHRIRPAIVAKGSAQPDLLGVVGKGLLGGGEAALMARR